jgi:hypothetical protein
MQKHTKKKKKKKKNRVGNTNTWSKLVNEVQCINVALDVVYMSTALGADVEELDDDMS